MSNSITQIDYDAVEINTSIVDFFKRFHIGSILKSSNIHKTKGVSPQKIMEYLFTLVFMGKSMYMDHQLNSSDKSCAKDVVYRFMKNGSANWNKFTELLAAKIAKTFVEPVNSEDRVNVFIVDDSIF